MTEIQETEQEDTPVTNGVILPQSVTTDDIPPNVTDTVFSLRELRHPQSKHTPEQKIAAVAAYHVTGSCLGAEKETGISHNTIKWWKSSAVWWPKVMDLCQKETDDKMCAKMRQVVDKSVDGVLKAVENGETRLDKQGNQITVFPAAREQAWIAAVFTDKIRVAQGRPTTISNRSQSEILSDLGNKLEKLSQEMRKSNEMKVVSEQ
jgi:hypothetical protein